MAYLYAKSIHIIFVVSWFAGLFYIVRLFIYHTEANDRSMVEQQVLKDQYKLMERRLWNIITTPAMILTLASGFYMIWLNPALLRQDWMLVKLGFVVGLIIYHYLCSGIIRQLHRDEFRFSSAQLRLWNEVATIFLVAIVFIVVLKNAVSWIWGILGLLIFSGIIMLAVRIYKYFRLKK